MNKLRRTARIRNFARLIRWLTLVAMCAVVVVTAYAIAGGGSTSVGSAVFVQVDPSGGINAHRMWYPWLEILPSSVLLYGLYRLTQLLRGWERGDLLSKEVGHHLQAFAAAVAVFVLLTITAPLQVALAMALAGHHGTTALTFSAAQVALFGLALLFLVVAWILSEAADLAEDHAKIV